MTNGIFALHGYTPTHEVLDHIAWLRNFYEITGRDPKEMRQDILNFSANRGLLENFSFGDQAAMFSYRLYILKRDEEIGTANDNDATLIDPGRYLDSDLKEKERRIYNGSYKCRESHLPRIQWRPFTPISRARAWSREQYQAALKRGLPLH